MKFLNLFPALMLGLMVCGCSDDDTQKSNELLSSDEQTAKLQTVGNAALSLIDAEDHRNIADVVGYYMERYAGYGVDGAYYMHVMTGLMPDMMRKSPISTVNSYLQLVNDMASKKIPSIDKKYYQQVLALTDMASLYGEFTANDSLMMWQYNDSTIKDRLQLSYKDSLDRDVVVTMKGSGPTTTMRVDYSYFDIDSTINYEGNQIVSNDTTGFFATLTLPEQIIFSVSVDGTQIAALTFVTSLDCNIVAEYYDVFKNNEQISEYEEAESAATNVDFEKLNIAVVLDINNYQAKIDWLLEPDLASMNLGLIIKNQSVISLDAKLGGQFSEMLSSNNDDNYDSNSLFDKLSSLDLNLDIMGQVQVKGTCFRLDSLAKIIMLSDQINNQKVDDSMRKFVDSFNDLTDFYIYFDKGNDINSSVYLKYYPNTESEDEYITPVIEFKKDGSVLQCSEFFNKEKYSDLINNSMDKAFGFMTIFGNLFSAFM